MKRRPNPASLLAANLSRRRRKLKEQAEANPQDHAAAAELQTVERVLDEVF